MISFINEIILVLAMIANFVTFISLVTFKRARGGTRKPLFALIAWAVACVSLMAGTYALRCLVEGHPYDALLHFIASILICAEILFSGGNVSTAMRGGGYGSKSD